MYSQEARMRAIELFIKYDKHVTKTVRELGYPSGSVLTLWYKDYIEEQETGIPRSSKLKGLRFSIEEKQAALDYYFANGRNLLRTVKAMGYPSVMMLRRWCDRYRPGERKIRGCGIIYSKEQKGEAVYRLNFQEANLKDLSEEYSVLPGTIQNWQKKMLGEENYIAMRKDEDTPIFDEKEALLSEKEALEKEVRRLKLEVALLRGAAELIKKDPGVDLKDLNNKEKSILIDALRNEYTLKELLHALQMPCSSYCYHHNLASMPSKYEELRDRIKDLFDESGKVYGYRRIHALLRKEDKILSEKVVRRIMKESGLFVYGKKSKKYNSYKGEDIPGADNLIERDFHAETPNLKWLTDITEFAIPAGKVYLSPIVDCFDGLLPGWTIGTSPNAELVNAMLDKATATLKEGENPLVHSDRGFHYRWPGWIERMAAAGLKRSMSRKGCSPDNAACEGLFGRIKNEMFYNQQWQGVSLDEFIKTLDDYLIWYNEKRIKMSLGAMSPLQYRQSLNLLT